MNKILLAMIVVLILSCSKKDIFESNEIPGVTAAGLISVNKMQSVDNEVWFLGKDERRYDIRNENEKFPYEFRQDPYIRFGGKIDQYESRIEEVPLTLTVFPERVIQIPVFPDTPADLPAENVSNWLDGNKKVVNGYQVHILNTCISQETPSAK